MRDRDEVAKLTLRAVKTAITEMSKSGADIQINDEMVMQVLQREAKRRRDAAAEYEELHQADRAAQEQAELAILEQYLPKQLEDREIEAIVREVLAETGASSMREMGAVMSAVMQRVTGLADGKRVNQIVRRLLT
jgi:uncharacterized protein YqeY